MNEIDYTDLKLIDNFTYDIHPNEKGEIRVAFKHGEDSFVMPIPKQDLERMLWFANQK
ncbi:hypothetical protein [Bacillus sp. REN10]|uniref:hypothetical protein n=1 Tax=Bacillus sp. REN10 TaxID=2782541 RepID=UPI00193B6447|nr:hypothetical protein [Bacillus sp. REN10]